MINNRLFKKINSIFWGILTWLPLVLLILATFMKDFSYQFDSQSNFTLYFNQLYAGAFDVLSNASDYWFNPLSPIFMDLFELLDSVGSGPFYFVLIDMASWICWVQVVRLMVYVFYWFIDLITGLFDYLSFNKRGDN